MTHYKITAAIVVALSTIGPCWATTVPKPGPAPFDEAIAYYYTGTGEITVSANNLASWFVQSDSLSLTGDPPINLPAGGGLVSDNDGLIGESAFGVLTFTDLELGPVADLFLPEGDLIICFNDAGIDFPQFCSPVIHITIPEPTAIALLIMASLTLAVIRSCKPLATEQVSDG